MPKVTKEPEKKDTQISEDEVKALQARVSELEAEQKQAAEKLDAQLDADAQKEEPKEPRVLRKIRRADGSVEEITDFSVTNKYGDVNPLTLLTPKDPAFHYRWISKFNGKPERMLHADWEYVRGRGALRQGIDGQPVGDTVELHDLVLMRIPIEIWKARQKAKRERFMSAGTRAEQILRQRVEGQGERVFGRGVSKTLTDVNLDDDES